MRKLVITTFAVAIALCTFSTAQAALVSLEGDVGLLDPTTTSGQLQIIVDIAPENNTFTNGGLSLSVRSSNPGVIEFTGGEVDNRSIFGALIWSLTGVQGVTPSLVGDVFAASVSTQALNPALPMNPRMDGGTDFLFATLNYNVVGQGRTDVSVEISQRTDPVFSNGNDVSGTLTFEDSFIEIIPEPASLLLISMGVVGLVGLRRRQG